MGVSVEKLGGAMQSFIKDTTSGAATKSMLYALKKIEDRFKNTPTSLVMTNRTLRVLKKQFGFQEIQHGQYCVPGTLFGVPVEVYPNMKECFDRMVEKRSEADRPKFVQSEEIPDDLVRHPFIMTQLERTWFVSKEN